MRLCGWDGLAVAVMKQAAHDYCEMLRWVRDKGNPGLDCEEELKKFDKECKKKKISLLAPGIKQYRMRLKKQLTVERSTQALEVWFRSNEYATLSTVDGEELMNDIKRRLALDPSFRILLGDDF